MIYFRLPQVRYRFLKRGYGTRPPHFESCVPPMSSFHSRLQNFDKLDKTLTIDKYVGFQKHVPYNMTRLLHGVRPLPFSLTIQFNFNVVANAIIVLITLTSRDVKPLD